MYISNAADLQICKLISKSFKIVSITLNIPKKMLVQHKFSTEYSGKKSILFHMWDFHMHVINSHSTEKQKKMLYIFTMGHKIDPSVLCDIFWSNVRAWFTYINRNWYEDRLSKSCSRPWRSWKGRWTYWISMGSILWVECRGAQFDGASKFSISIKSTRVA